MVPGTGAIVKVRSRQYLVEEVVSPASPSEQAVVRLCCLDDDAQGAKLDVLWEKELDAQVLTGTNWKDIAQRGFDLPERFSS